MTTAHRPTWKAAVGQSSEGGWSAGGAVSTGVSHLDLAGHTKLKVRKGKQTVDHKKALRESLLKLEEAEKKSTSTNKKSFGHKQIINPEIEKQGRIKLLKQTAEIDDEAIRNKYNDSDADDDSDSDSNSDDGFNDVRNENKKKKNNNSNNNDDDDTDLDDSDDSDDDSDDSDDDSDDSDDDDDDEAALQAELAKIRAEREEAKAKEDAKIAAEEESKLEEAALIGNPLLLNENGNDIGVGTTGKMKRKWNEDVVFRNQAKSEPKIQKRFINDTVRNDFHKRFLNKFMR